MWILLIVSTEVVDKIEVGDILRHCFSESKSESGVINSIVAIILA